MDYNEFNALYIGCAVYLWYLYFSITKCNSLRLRLVYFIRIVVLVYFNNYSLIPLDYNEDLLFLKFNNIFDKKL